MNCRESRLMIPAWVDHELPARDAEGLEAHLNACDACAAFAQGQGAFVRGLREHFPRPSAPPELKGRLLALARGERRPGLGLRAWRRAWIGAGGMALVACLLLILVGRPLAGDWTRFYLQEHQAHDSADSVQFAADSPKQVAAWLASSLGHPVHVPGMKDARLLGGRITRLRGQDLAQAVYESKGRVVSLFMGDPKLLCPPGLGRPDGELYAQDGQALSLVAWQHNGHFHVAVSTLTLVQLKELARQCQASL